MIRRTLLTVAVGAGLAGMAAGCIAVTIGPGGDARRNPAVSRAPATEPEKTAAVAVPWNDFRIDAQRMDREMRMVYFSRESRNGACVVPVGSYSQVRVTLFATDGNGARWAMESRAVSGLKELSEGDTATLQIAPPFTAFVSAGDRTLIQPGVSMSFTARITDANGTPYSFPEARGLRIARKPKLLLKDAQGREVGRVAFESSLEDGWQESAPVSVPSEEGKYFASVELPDSGFDIRQGEAASVAVAVPKALPREPYAMTGRPLLQLAAQPKGPDAIELLWEINDIPPPECAATLHSQVGSFVGEQQRELLKDKSFEVLSGVDGAHFLLLGRVQGPDNSYVQKGVAAGQLFFYKVRARDAAGEVVAESAVIPAATGRNLVAHGDFEDLPVGPCAASGAADNLELRYPESFAIVADSRPYSSGAKALRFDCRFADDTSCRIEGPPIRIAQGKAYLQSGWVLAPGTDWVCYGRRYRNSDKDGVAWAYALHCVTERPRWMFVTQLLLPDEDGAGYDRSGEEMKRALKDWTYPKETPYLSFYVPAEGPGEVDDNWIVEVTPPPPPQPEQPSGK